MAKIFIISLIEDFVICHKISAHLDNVCFHLHFFYESKYYKKCIIIIIEKKILSGDSAMLVKLKMQKSKLDKNKSMKN